MDVFNRLYRHFGPCHWWPGDSPLEVMVGAVLTQNTAWSNVAKAIAALRAAGKLDLDSLHHMTEADLAQLIRPAGYFNIKAKRLKNLIIFVAQESGGNVENLFNGDVESLRQRLLTVQGIGPETADSILLYAGQLPTFVVDAYTIRILNRHGFVASNAQYEAVRNMFMENLPADTSLYNEYHALLVNLGKHYCQKRTPKCTGCPLEGV
jgi:endonuclease-3 related protein